MNVGIDIRCLTSPHLTGVGQYTKGLLRSLFDIDKENNYYLFYNSHKDVSKFVPTFNNDNVKVCNTKYPNKLLHSSVKIFKKPTVETLIRGELDIFYSPNLHFTSLNPKTKSVLTIHDLSFELFPECFSRKRQVWHSILKPKEQCKRADKIIVPSGNTKRDVMDYYGIDGSAIEVIPPGISIKTNESADVQKKYNIPDNIILYLGTIEPRKNIIGAIEAFNISGLKEKGYKLVIAGSRGWKCNSIFEKIKQTEEVEYIGFVDELDKMELYRLAKIFIYPSLYEGFGLPVLEAMSVGTPTITSNRSSLPEVVCGGAYLVDPYNLGEISRAMIDLVENTGLRNNLSEKGRVVCNRYKWESSSKKFLETLNSIL